MDTIAAVNANLYGKMEESFQEYTNWLLKQSPEEILDHAFEYTIKDKILLVVEYNNLTEAQANALLAADAPLDLLYNEVGDSATITQDALFTLVENKADELAAPKENYSDIQIYPYSAIRAEQDGDLYWYRQSHKLNIACKEAIEHAISRHYRSNTLNTQAVQDVVQQFSLARTSFVLVNTILSKSWDGRISPDNKQWAKLAPMYPDLDAQGNDRRLRYILNIHPGLTDILQRPFVVNISEIPNILRSLLSETILKHKNPELRRNVRRS